MHTLHLLQVNSLWDEYRQVFTNSYQRSVAYDIKKFACFICQSYFSLSYMYTFTVQRHGLAFVVAGCGHCRTAVGGTSLVRCCCLVL